MQSDAPSNRPDWLSEDMYPFASRYFSTPDGHRMHYVLEGEGPDIVFVHGNPAWSFEFRGLIRELRANFRCIAIDHIGFGLSSRSTDYQEFHPRQHALRLAALLDHLDVRDAAFFLSDWGGPIGLQVAQQQPHRMARLIITHTWCWPVNRDPYYILFSSMMGGPLGRWLIRRFNFFVNGVLPRAMGPDSALPPDVMNYYRFAQPSPEERTGCAAFPGYILKATNWLESIWNDRGAFCAKPTLVLWGMRDIAFRKKELDRWVSELSDARVHQLPDIGHFVAEEAPHRVLPLIREFMGQGSDSKVAVEAS